MNFTPLFESSGFIILHALCAILAIVLGAVQLFMAKGTSVHRYLGRTWVGLMVVVSLSSFGINEFRMLGPFSVIHLLSLLVLYSAWRGVTTARSGEIQQHKKYMVQLYIMALILTGGFTLLPGRIMNTVIFGS